MPISRRPRACTVSPTPRRWWWTPTRGCRIDTAATFGAIEWIKATGSGPTGWRVSNGDTKWVTLTDFLNGCTYVSGPTTCRVRRVNERCYLTLEIVTPSDYVAGMDAITLPDWARPTFFAPVDGYTGQVWYLGAPISGAYSTVKFASNGASSARRTGMYTYPTDRPWRTS